MFEALRKASPANRYNVAWLGLPMRQFEKEVEQWVSRLQKSRFAGGPDSTLRKQLGQEFHDVLYMFRQMVSNGGGDATRRHQGRLAWYVETMTMKYVAIYSSRFKTPFTPPVDASTDDRVARLQACRTVLEDKLALIEFWRSGTSAFPTHNEQVAESFQYLGNMDTSKVRLFLDVLVNDAEKVLRDPRAMVTRSGSFSTGLKRLGGDGKLATLEMTDDDYKRTIKAEFGAAYGMMAQGKCEFAVTGIKASIDAQLFAGALAKGGIRGSIGMGGASLKGEVEAMLGIKVVSNANLDVADIFLIEASAKAFAGAMAAAAVEITASYSGITVKLTAEALAGAELKGKGSLNLRMCGYDLIKGTAEASLIAGIGGKAGLTLSCSAFSATEVKLSFGFVLGIGASVDTGFALHADNVSKVAYTVFYSGYLLLVSGGKARYTWRNYFRSLEDNRSLFNEAETILMGLLVDNYRLINAAEGGDGLTVATLSALREQAGKTRELVLG